MASVTSAMQNAFSVMAQFHPDVTSVIHGEHATDSAHYSGRAVDVGAFGGTIVGFNQPTWNAIVAAIQSGEFSKIGTIPELVDNQTLQALAKKNGVELFTDIGSGPHIHMQVNG